MKKYYAVLNGRETGIFESWDETKKQIDGYPGAKYKGFKTKKEAMGYLNGEESEETVKLNDGLCAFVDGSFDADSGRYSYGMVLIYNGEVKTENGVGSNEEAASMRNVAGELRGAMKAMVYASENGFGSVSIYHDYEGIAAWAEGRWKTNLEATRAYKEFADKMKKKINIKFVKVPAHSGVTYNEIADELAKAALKGEENE